MLSSDLAIAAASPVPIEWDGEELLLQPYTVHDFGAATNFLLKKKQDALLRMIAAQRENLPADVWREEWETAKKQAQEMVVLPQEVAGGVDENGVEHPNWLDSREGLAFTLWQLFDKTYPGKYTRRQIEDKLTWMEMQAIDEMEKLKNDRDRAAGLDEASRKNSNEPGADANAIVPAEKPREANDNKEVTSETISERSPGTASSGS